MSGITEAFLRKRPTCHGFVAVTYLALGICHVVLIVIYFMGLYPSYYLLEEDVPTARANFYYRQSRQMEKAEQAYQLNMIQCFEILFILLLFRSCQCFAICYGSYAMRNDLKKIVPYYPGRR